MTRRVVFSERAENQLDALYALIESGSGSARAESFTGEIVAFCMGLSLFPERGTRRDDLRPGLRVLGWRRRVTIALAVEPGAVVILGIFYGGQDWESDLEE
jgi:toxin ParE1/3/4